MMSLCYFDTNKKAYCTGCRACEHVCPKAAITMQEDEEGFFFPVINKELCVNCDLCRKVCPVGNPPIKNENYSLYAAQLKDANELRKSTSGGMFIALAKKIIEENGVVFGCVFDEEYNAIIVSAESYEELLPMQGSKYVQADTGDTYKAAKEFLDQNRKVMYTGTPCQISGLLKYLGKSYENLVTVDFLCHGVPSNKLFKNNVKYLEKKYKSKIHDYKFRDKSKRGSCMMTSFKLSAGRKVYQAGRINPYSNGFTNGWIDRLCCYECKFVGIERASDITIGDFWGLVDKSNEFKGYDGVSFVMFNSAKAEVLKKLISSEMILSERKIEEALSGNAGSLIPERKYTIPSNRSIIYENINNFEGLANGILKPKDLTNLKVKQILPKWLINLMRKLKK